VQRLALEDDAEADDGVDLSGPIGGQQREL